MKLLVLAFLLLIFNSCTPRVTYDCAGRVIRGRVSDSVIMNHEPQRPRLNPASAENVICRRGFPNRYILPWDQIFLAQGEGELANLNDQEQLGDNSEVQVVTRESVGDYWFEFSPLIHNNTPFNLIIKSIEIKALASNDSQNLIEHSFNEGYCGSSGFLYWLAPDESINRADREKAFNKGNLRFYVDGLTPPEPTQTEANRTNFQRTIVPNFQVTYRVSGYFACDDGAQRAGFEKSGNFSVAPSTF